MTITRVRHEPAVTVHLMAQSTLYPASRTVGCNKKCEKIRQPPSRVGFRFTGRKPPSSSVTTTTPGRIIAPKMTVVHPNPAALMNWVVFSLMLQDPSLPSLLNSQQQHRQISLSSLDLSLDLLSLDFILLVSQRPPLRDLPAVVLHPGFPFSP